MLQTHPFIEMEELAAHTLYRINKHILIGFFKYKRSELHITAKCIFIPIDFLFHANTFTILQHLILSKLKQNQQVYARLCNIEAIDKKTATAFLVAHHLLGYANAAYCYGLYFEQELLAVASFSKGRKMNRLAAKKRSFELVRFACKTGVGISGGLSKCLNAFIKDKQPGDVMTYIDKQFYDGSGFTKIGFTLHSETLPQHFWVDSHYKRQFVKLNSPIEMNNGIYQCANLGNIKLVLSC